ncbi:Uncharacterised protein [uncultured archaeon]|nr:Uncharacterised protein [uncultured archaeon]
MMKLNNNSPNDFDEQTKDSALSPNSKLKSHKIYFWEKWAYKPEDEEYDKLNFYEIEDEDLSIREVIREFESKTIGKKLLFSDVSTKNPSVKKWVNAIRDRYPERNDEDVEDLLNTFRDALYARSREKFKNIVGLLLLNDLLLLVHCKKDRSLAEWKDKIYSANLIFHPKNVLRAAIIKKDDEKTMFSAFEYSRKWSKGHAEFWGIEPEDVSWDSLGSISLTIQLPFFDYLIQLPIESEQLELMIKDKMISPTGDIIIGRGKGTITKVEVFRKYMDFANFYDFYITEKDRLMEHREKFRELIPHGEHQPIDSFDPELKDKYRYIDDVDKIFEITPEGNKSIHDKRHIRYTLCFSTKAYPRIKPSKTFINKLYQAIFQNYRLEIWHAGEETSDEPAIFGSLEIFNKIDVNIKLIEFRNSLLNIIDDAKSKKTTVLLQNYYCSLLSRNIKNYNIKVLFDFIKEDIIIPEMEFEFGNNGVCDKEELLEFKSSDDVGTKPGRFVRDTLVPTIRKYQENGDLTRFCILYGIEDNGEIRPVSRRVKSDQISYIETEANKELSSDNIKVSVQSIPFEEDYILAVFMMPDLEINRKISGKSKEDKVSNSV